MHVIFKKEKCIHCTTSWLALDRDIRVELQPFPCICHWQSDSLTFLRFGSRTGEPSSVVTSGVFWWPASRPPPPPTTQRPTRWSSPSSPRTYRVSMIKWKVLVCIKIRCRVSSIQRGVPSLLPLHLETPHLPQHLLRGTPPPVSPDTPADTGDQQPVPLLRELLLPPGHQE